MRLRVIPFCQSGFTWIHTWVTAVGIQHWTNHASWKHSYLLTTFIIFRFGVRFLFFIKRKDFWQLQMKAKGQNHNSLFGYKITLTREETHRTTNTDIVGHSGQELQWPPAWLLCRAGSLFIMLTKIMEMVLCGITVDTQAAHVCLSYTMDWCSQTACERGI